MSQRLVLIEEEYLDIEEALSGNARGRAFLRMRDQRSRLVGVAEVRRLVRDLKDGLPKVEVEAAATADKRDDPHIRILREELREMSAYINQTRKEIAALRPADAAANRIMAATGELDAIVSATERATSDILNGAERIQELAAKLPRTGEVGPIADEIIAQVTEVLTACSFQDITGQRTTKVVNTLRYIEQRVNSMIEIWGVDGLVAGQALAEPEDRRPDAHLMNGPAADGGPSQADVDALFERLTHEAAPADADAKRPAETAKVPAGSSATSTQNEIDALFGTAG
jgi:chemotaxis regulatin CheY-phosphate phosphatase CheZ